MSFSLSTFTVEVDHTPAIAFQTRRHAEAEQVCREWLRSHWDELAVEGSGGVVMPPIFTLRLARASERVEYEGEGNGVEFLGDHKIVKLIGAADQPEVELGTKTQMATPPITMTVPANLPEDSVD